MASCVGTTNDGNLRDRNATPGTATSEAFPDDTQMRAPEADSPLADMAKIERVVEGCASNFPSHEAALAALRPIG